ncbi:MAG: hypothetical protein U0175_10705 [Caldilineaceae bacterium]
MKRALILSLLLLFLLLTLSTKVQAASDDGVTVVPDSLFLVRTLPGDSVAASLRLNTNQPISNVTLLVSDLQGVGIDGQQLDPIPATNINVLPALQFDSLGANSITQLTLQLAPPANAGVYTGTLLIRWQAPESGEITLPIRLQLRTQPELVVHDPDAATGIQIYAATGSWLTPSTPISHLSLREKSGGATLHDLQVLPSDLIDAANHRMISGDILQVALADSVIEPGQLLTATMLTDLANAPAGDFKGNLTFVAKPNTLLTLPIEIQIRHPWYLPFLVLTIGVLLGLSLSSYQARGRLRDEFVVRSDNVRAALKEDKDLKQNFGTRIEQLLLEVDVAIRTAHWNEAETQVTEAEALLTKWRRDAENWKNQIDYLRNQVIQRLQAKITSYSPSSSTPQAIRKLRQEAEDLLQSVVDSASPSELRTKIIALEDNLHAFEQVESLWQELVQLRTDFDATKLDAKLLQEWLTAEETLRFKLLATSLDREALNALANEINVQKQKLSQTQEQHPDLLLPRPSATSEATSRGVDGEVPTVYFPGISPARDYNPESARKRLSRNAILLYILSAIVLVAVGMSTLYVPNLTFGSNLVSDYFSIFIFGLGAQTTVASATDLLQRWGIPFTKQ